jgi:hypothetical protein
MAWEHGVLDLGQFAASSDYNDAADQFCIVRMTTGLTWVKTSAVSDNCLGVLQDRPSSGIAANVRVLGVSKVRVSATTHTAIVPGTKLTGGVGGGAMPSTVLTANVLGVSFTALAANTTGIISMLILHRGAGSSAGGAGA